MSMKQEEMAKHLLDLARSLSEAAEAIKAIAAQLCEGEATPSASSVESKVRTELDANLQYVDLMSSGDEIRIRPKRFLGTELFRTIASVSRKYGGRWDGGQRSFIIPTRPRG